MPSSSTLSLLRVMTIALVSLLPACAQLVLQDKSNPAQSMSSDEPPLDIRAKVQKTERRTNVPVPPPSDVWERIRRGQKLTHELNPRIENAIKWFKQNPDVISAGSARATPFLFHIVSELENRHLPTELALIPLIESGYRTHAYSRFGAAGLWQFMPATGRQYGLRDTHWFNARADLVQSTDAGLRYLVDLYHRFDNDWLLAVAAYNCGPGTVSRALNRSVEKSIWAILHSLPKETQQYVPKFVAINEIVANHRQYNFHFEPIENHPAFETIEVAGPIDLHVLKESKSWQSQEIDDAEFTMLNGGLSSLYIDDQSTITLHLPLGTGESIARFAANLSPQQKLPVEKYAVRKGDTLSRIATRFQVPISRLKRRNDIRGDLIRVGQQLWIDRYSDRSALQSEQLQQHIVRRGDSLWSISKQYQTSARKIAVANDLSLSTTLQPGQGLFIPGRSVIKLGATRTTPRPTSQSPSAPVKSPPDPSASDKSYVVQAGDSLWRVARRFEVSVSDLKRWNALMSNSLLPGQILIVKQTMVSVSGE